MKYVGINLEVALLYEKIKRVIKELEMEGHDKLACGKVISTAIRQMYGDDKISCPAYIWAVLLMMGHSSNYFLSRQVGVPRTTVGNILRRLHRLGFVKMEKIHKGNRGRPTFLWSVSSHSRYRLLGGRGEVYEVVA